MVASIKKAFVSNQNILLVDQDNTLWIMGNNRHKKTGFGKKDEHIYIPVCTNLTLESDEEVKLFYAEKAVLVIYTNKNRIYLAHHSYRPGGKSSREADNTSLIDQVREMANRNIRLLDNLVARSFPLEIVEDEMSISLPPGLMEDEMSNRSDDSDTETDSSPGSSDEEADHPDRHDDLLFLNNIYYQRELSRYNQNNSSPPDGFFLFEENVDELTVVYNVLFFKKGPNIYFYNIDTTPTRTIIGKDLGLNCLFINKGEHSYYQIIFPFEAEKIVFCKNFVYLRSPGLHHVFSMAANSFETGRYITWFYFRSELKIDPDQIYYSPYMGDFYVYSNKTLYKYYYKTCTLEKMSTENDRIFIMFDTKNDQITPGIVRSDGLYWDYNGLKKVTNYFPLLEYLVDANQYDNDTLILVNNDSPQRYQIHGNDLYFNVEGLAYYKLYNDGVVYYENNNTLYFLSVAKYEESFYGTQEVEKISVGVISYYLYLFNDVPVITDIQFTGKMMLIQSNNQYYYHTIDSDSFTVNKFTEIDLVKADEQIPTVVRSQIFRSRKEFNQKIDLNIGIKSDRFQKMLNIMEMLRPTTDFSIEYTDGYKRISYGDGPKREFIEEAISQFAERYLIFHNYYPEFNLKEIEKLNDSELFAIGAMLHATIHHSMDPLAIRLPVVLINDIKENKKISLRELEYFAKIEDPEFFSQVHPYRDKPDEFRKLESGYETYEEVIQHICKFYTNDEETNLRIGLVSKQIAKGVLSYNIIKNLSVMNHPTLDYYLSGDLKLDRKALLKNLEIVNDTADEYPDFYNLINKTIETLSEEKLRILLKNWSGSSLVKKDLMYGVIIKNEPMYDVQFITCSIQINISNKMISDPENLPQLLNLLTTPMGTMLDE